MTGTAQVRKRRSPRPAPVDVAAAADEILPQEVKIPTEATMTMVQRTTPTIVDEMLTQKIDLPP